MPFIFDLVIGCRVDDDCSPLQACVNSKCTNPCEARDACEANAKCEVRNREAICARPPTEPVVEETPVTPMKYPTVTPAVPFTLPPPTQPVVAETPITPMTYPVTPPSKPFTLPPPPTQPVVAETPITPMTYPVTPPSKPFTLPPPAQTPPPRVPVTAAPSPPPTQPVVVLDCPPCQFGEECDRLTLTCRPGKSFHSCFLQYPNVSVRFSVSFFIW